MVFFGLCWSFVTTVMVDGGYKEYERGDGMATVARSFQYHIWSIYSKLTLLRQIWHASHRCRGVRSAISGDRHMSQYYEPFCNVYSYSLSLRWWIVATLKMSGAIDCDILRSQKCLIAALLWSEDSFLSLSLLFFLKSFVSLCSQVNSNFLFYWVFSRCFKWIFLRLRLHFVIHLLRCWLR